MRLMMPIWRRRARFLERADGESSATRRARFLERADGESSATRDTRSRRRTPSMLKPGRRRARTKLWSVELKKLIGLTDLPLAERGRVILPNALMPAEKS